MERELPESFQSVIHRFFLFLMYGFFQWLYFFGRRSRSHVQGLPRMGSPSCSEGRPLWGILRRLYDGILVFPVISVFFAEFVVGVPSAVTVCFSCSSAGHCSVSVFFARFFVAEVFSFSDVEGQVLFLPAFHFRGWGLRPSRRDHAYPCGSRIRGGCVFLLLLFCRDYSGDLR